MPPKEKDEMSHIPTVDKFMKLVEVHRRSLFLTHVF